MRAGAFELELQTRTTLQTPPQFQPSIGVPMTDMNPYESPTAEFPELQAQPVGKRSVILALFVFAIVSFGTFLVLVLTVFGDSTETWPGFVSGGIAVGLGGLAAYRAATSRSVLWFEPASFVAAAVVGLLMVVAVLAYRRSPDDFTRVLLPTSLQTTPPGHWILFGFAVVGAACGAWGLVRGFKTNRLFSSLIGGVCAAACLCYALATIAVRMLM